MRRVLVFAALAASFALPAFADEAVLRAVAGPTIGVPGERTMQLRGSGLFRYLGIKLYRIYFYVSPGAADPSAELGRHPMRLVFKYMHDIPATALVEAAENNLRKNPEVDYEAIRERVSRLHARYSDLKPGDECALVYRGGKTLAVFKGRPAVEIEGEDFARAYFGIWLSKYSISQKLRKSLLGERAAS